MNNPVPAPPKNRAKKTNVLNRKSVPKPAKKSNAKLITYICVVPGKNGQIKEHEVRAEKITDVGQICLDKYGRFPIDVKKKPYKMPEHMTQRLNNHEGLQALAKKLNKKAGRK